MINSDPIYPSRHACKLLLQVLHAVNCHACLDYRTSGQDIYGVSDSYEDTDCGRQRGPCMILGGKHLDCLT